MLMTLTATPVNVRLALRVNNVILVSLFRVELTGLSPVVIVCVCVRT